MEHGKPTDGDICGQGRRYLRAKAEISAGKGGDIRVQAHVTDRIKDVSFSPIKTDETKRFLSPCSVRFLY